jgi:tetratricopeptide (TPR) repeat protein
MKIINYLFVALILVGCASRQAGWEKQTERVSLTEAELKSLTNEAKSLWSQRADTEKLKASLTIFEKIHAANPKNLDALIYLTRGNYFLADSHLQEMSKKKEVYEKAAAFGEKAMATNSAFQQSISEGKTVEDSLITLTEAEVPAIYWTAASLGKWAKASGIAAQLKYKTRIKGMIERVEKLRPDYFYGAVPRYWGGYFAVAPSFAGGDMKKSKKNFDRSLAIAPEYIGTKVLMAEVYWTKQGDRKQFESVLKDVLSSKFDQHPELGPENIWEKKKAEKLLKNADELF